MSDWPPMPDAALLRRIADAMDAGDVEASEFHVHNEIQIVSSENPKFPGRVTKTPEFVEQRIDLKLRSRVQLVGVK